MFYNLVSPEEQQAIGVLAISINKNTLTLYKRTYERFPTFGLNHIPIFGHQLMKWVQNNFVKPEQAEILKVDQSTPHISIELDTDYYKCLDRSKKKHNYHYILRNDIKHDELHSETDKFEQYIQHYHIEHQQQITHQDLQIFLMEMLDCGKNKNSKNEKLITESIKEKILSAYSEYLQAKQADLSAKNPYQRFTNNPCYNNQDLPNGLPTVYQHAQCMINNQLPGCMPSEPISSGCQEFVANYQETNTNLALGTAALGLFFVGLFAKKWRGIEQAVEQKPSTKKTKKKVK